MAEVHIHASAWRDLHDISEYTEREWGAAQADRYANQIFDRLDLLRQHPYAGPVRPDLGGLYHALRVGQHTAFYRVQNQTVHVIRILHAAMDPDRHLDEDT